MQLLKELCAVHATSGNEGNMKNFLLNYINQHQGKWGTQPQIFEGDQFLDCIVLVFGKPKTAIFAHMDSIGFTVRYDNKIIPIGGPEFKNGYILTGEDKHGPIEATMVADEDGEVLCIDFPRIVAPGTDLVFKSNFRESAEYIQSPYLDNRLGIWNALQVAETLEDGIIAFTCWEEHGGGSIPLLAKFIYEEYGVRQALISDITWITEGIHHGKGVVISLRDKSIPRRSFVNKILDIASKYDYAHQIEVEQYGGSDGKELQASPYPFDWCFIGAAEDFVHSPDEKVHKADIVSMTALYRVLMREL